MDLNEALRTLGVERVVWIDDIFTKTRGDLFQLLMDNLDVAKAIDYPGLAECLNDYDIAGQALRGFIEDLDRDQLDSLEEKYFEADAKTGSASTVELKSDRIDKTTRLLGVAEADRWTFEAARTEIPKACKHGDAAVGYVVDLRNGAHAPEEGIETLLQLAMEHSRGTMFILTHEATVATEGSLEVTIRQKISERAEECPPVCVISKDRLRDAEDDAGLEDVLKVAVKRAGLRRIVHEVVSVARENLMSSFGVASELLLSIPPEQLDTFIVDRGYNEGVSELHVVERAITAKLSDEIRTLFAQEGVISKAERLRSFREIDLKPDVIVRAHESLEIFRRLEIQESGDLINASFSPISSGDIFALDEQEFRANNFVQKRFLLLGQPCDVQIRWDGKRDAATAYLIPLTEVVDEHAPEKFKSRRLPFKIGGCVVSCNFRDATTVRLDILDLASFRSDGRVAFDSGQTTAPNMLPGLNKIFAERVAMSAAELPKAPANPIEDSRFCLTFISKSFKQIYTAKHQPAAVAMIRGQQIRLKNRVTWSIRRDSRLKPPYAASLLRDFLSISGRDAFDIDFTQLARPEVVAATSCA